MTLTEQGKRLISLREYAEGLMPLDCESDFETTNHYGAVTDSSHNSVLAVRTFERGYSLMPGPEFSPRLYRGQNKYYDTCIPSAFRFNRGIDMIFWRAKLIEVFEVIVQHPAFISLFNYRIEGLIFDIDFEGLAQHYGYPTTFMDFSRSKDIAMFFATCSYCEKSDTYQPMKSGSAALYTIDFKGLINCNSSTVQPLGLQPLPRPEAQQSLAVRMSGSGNLNNMPWARHEKIEITPQLSHKYYDIFEGGAKLFPKNPFDSFIQRLRMSKSLSLESLEDGIKHDWTPPHPEGIDAAVRAFEEAGYTIVEKRVELSHEVIDAADKEWQERSTDYFSRIKLRGVCDLLILNNEGNPVTRESSLK